MAISRLGPWDLQRLLASGGMGEVWEATHYRRGTRAAVKRLLVEKQDHADHLRAEIRAVAALDHPHIVQILDHGEQEGPWLAMELARGAMPRSVPDFTTFRAVMLALLDGLGHAHARGVFHRDLKTENVLVGGMRPGPRLSDFGLAFSLDPTSVAPIEGGTPVTMAPEQFYDPTITQGPWTDLYGLGCVAWDLLVGKPPFLGATYHELAVKHLNDPIPPFEPKIAVPVGLEQWLHRALAKRPVDRWRRAADMAHALQQLDDVKGDARVHAPEGEIGPTEVASPQDPVLPVALGGEVQVAPRPPLPKSWDTRYRWVDPPGWNAFVHLPAPADPPTTVAALRVRQASASLGLFGLRSVPPVGRAEIRTALWKALRRGAEEPVMVLLRGPAGAGKTHLADWLCTRAHETGAASAAVAYHDRTPGKQHGLGGLIRRQLRYPRTENQLRERAEALGVPEVAEAHPLVAAGLLVSELTRERPVVLMLDDLQWGPLAIRLSEALLESGLPVTVVATVREEALLDLPGAEDGVERLVDMGAEEIQVGPLTQADTAAMLSALLPIEPGLLRRLIERGAGNPLFAVQLLQELVSQERLVADDGVFRLDGSEELPETLSEVWDARVERLLGAHPKWRDAIEIAACLGHEVDRREWRSACPNADEGLLVALVVERLARATDNGFAFVHGMFRDAVLRAATPRLAGHHARCVEAVSPNALQQARRARHLFASGAFEASLEPLVNGAWDARLSGDYGLALELLALRYEAVQALEGPQTAAHFGTQWARMMFLSELGDLPAALRVAGDVRQLVAVHGTLRMEVMLGMWDARMLQHAGEYGASDLSLVKLVPDTEKLELDQVRWHQQHYLLWNALHTGAYAAAEGLLAWQHSHADIPVLHLDTGIGQAALHLARGQYEDAERVARESGRIAEEIGHDLGRGMAATQIGITQLRRGQLEASLVSFRQAIRIHTQTGVMLVLLARIQLARLRVLGDHTAAREQLHRVMGDARLPSLDHRHRFDLHLVAAVVFPGAARDEAVEAVTQTLRKGFDDASTAFVLGLAEPSLQRLLRERLRMR